MKTNTNLIKGIHHPSQSFDYLTCIQGNKIVHIEPLLHPDTTEIYTNCIREAFENCKIDEIYVVDYSRYASVNEQFRKSIDHVVETAESYGIPIKKVSEDDIKKELSL